MFYENSSVYSEFTWVNDTHTHVSVCPFKVTRVSIKGHFTDVERKKEKNGMMLAAKATYRMGPCNTYKLLKLKILN